MAGLAWKRGSSGRRVRPKIVKELRHDSASPGSAGAPEGRGAPQKVKELHHNWGRWRGRSDCRGAGTRK